MNYTLPKYLILLIFLTCLSLIVSAADPSLQPTGQPSGVPSSLPHSQPSSQPTTVPSSLPHSLPSSQPSSQPTTVPSSLPHSLPSSQPSSQPTTVPSSLPHSLPSSQPSSQPTTVPSSLPHSLPSSQPSSLPTSPSSQPTTSPIGNPTALPTGQPSLHPTTQPSTVPSNQPTTVPSSLPTSPSGQPTTSPIGNPTALPTGQPSIQPTGIPSCVPSLQPSGQPSMQPTAIPSSQPTGQPSSQPSAQPSSVPSCQPSSTPTTASLPRNVSCGECESLQDGVCMMFSEFVHLQCESNDDMCSYVGIKSFIVTSGTVVSVSGSCDLVINATEIVSLAVEGVLEASSIQLTADRVEIYGILDSSGRGAMTGRGKGVDGSGGSYGGSAGKISSSGLCGETFFSIYDEQIGSIDVWEDVTSDPVWGGRGSGGGEIGGGVGGGLIMISGYTVDISNGKIYSSGSVSSLTGVGSGSGGGISIIAAESFLSTNADLRVNGGMAVNDRDIAGGSGGRISVKVPMSFDMSLTFWLQGGGNDAAVKHSCLVGASGTLLWMDTNLATVSLVIHNGGSVGRAVTLLTEVPVLNALTSMLIDGGAATGLVNVESTNNYLEVSHESSLVGYHSVLKLTSMTATSFENVFFNILVESLRVVSGSVLTNAHGSINLNVGLFFQEQGSRIEFGCTFESRARDTFIQEGQVSQSIYSVNNCRAISSSHVLLGYYIHSPSIIAADVSAMTVVLNGTTVNVEGSYLHVPRLNYTEKMQYSDENCLRNYTVSQFRCLLRDSSYDTFNSSDFRMQVLIVAFGALTVESGVVIDAPTIEVCAKKTISVHASAKLTTSGRGCPHNSGGGAGQPPQSSASIMGGGGGGFGGDGGDGSMSTMGGSSYSRMSRFTFSYGSGGGAIVEMNSNDESSLQQLYNNSAGGGLIVLSSEGTIRNDGDVFADGASAGHSASNNVNGGGGSGGMILLQTSDLQGNGNFSISGGDGGYAGGGGGGGGRFEVDIFGDSASYTFTGRVKRSGGDINTNTFVDNDGNVYPQMGVDGTVLYPLCPEGRGNNFSALEFCKECDVDEYSNAFDTTECQPCNNKPDDATYVEDPNKQCAFQCDAGFQGTDCLTPFEFFVSNLGGAAVFYTLIVGVGCLLVLPLLFLRARQNHTYKIEKRKMLDIEKKSKFTVFANSGETTPDEAVNPMQKYSTYDCDLSGDGSGEHIDRSIDKSVDTRDDTEANFKNSTFGQNIAPSPAVFFKSTVDILPFNELRLYARLSDKDLRYHAGRIYFNGVNSPLSWMGGAWSWPSQCPQSLAYCVHPDQYKQFTRRINSSMEYKSNGWELVMYCLVLLLAPPFAEQFLLNRRLARAKILLHTISTTRNPFFKSHQSSLRVSVSPDLTVAYIDFLVDIEFHQKCVKLSRVSSGSGSGNSKPTSPTVSPTSSSPSNSFRSPAVSSWDVPSPGAFGQPKLPICIRFSGMGTYFSPWHLDTNDILLQAIPLSNDVSVFIDKAFINFVYELNKLLKSLRRHRLKEDLVVLLKNLLDERWMGALGGLVVQFCCIPVRLSGSLVSGVDIVSVTSTPPSEYKRETSIDHSAKSFTNNFTSFDSTLSNEAVKPIETLAEFSVLSAELSRHDKKNTPTERKVSRFTMAPGISKRNNGSIKNVPSYSEVDYEKMAEAIQNGVMCPGVVFYHESTPLDDILPQIPDAKFPSNIPSLEQSNSKSTDASSEDNVMRESAVQLQQKAVDNYGDKAKELEKFYNILKVADKRLDSKSEEVSPHEFVKEVKFEEDDKNYSISPYHQSNTDSTDYSRDSDLSDPRPTSSLRPQSQLVESLSQFELTSFSVAPEDFRSRRGSVTNSLDSSIIQMNGSSAFMNPVTIWFWNHLENMPKVLNRDVASSKPATVTLPERILPREWIWNTFQQRKIKLHNICEEVFISQRYSFLEAVIMFLCWCERKLSHGHNKVTDWNNVKIVRRFLTVFLFLLIVLDVMLFGAFGVIFFCIYDKTGCDDQSGLVVMIMVWPFALFMAPLYGLRCVILTPLGRLARQYRCWSNYVNITALAIIAVYWQFYDNTPRYYLYLVLTMVLSRVCQYFLIDVYIETQEDKRNSRGWDGLFTSVTHSEYDFH